VAEWVEKAGLVRIREEITEEVDYEPSHCRMDQSPEKGLDTDPHHTRLLTNLMTPGVSKSLTRSGLAMLQRWQNTCDTLGSGSSLPVTHRPAPAGPWLTVEEGHRFTACRSHHRR
jgi:hypothetical protein